MRDDSDDANLDFLGGYLDDPPDAVTPAQLLAQFAPTYNPTTGRFRDEGSNTDGWPGPQHLPGSVFSGGRAYP
jgi:hypothetical protein